jgi:hypothetical protein
MKAYVNPEALKVGDVIKFVSYMSPYNSEFDLDGEAYDNKLKLNSVHKVIRINPPTQITYGFLSGKLNPIVDNGFTAWWGTWVYVDRLELEEKQYGIVKWLKKYYK